MSYLAEKSDLKRSPQYENYTNVDYNSISEDRLKIERSTEFAPDM